MADNQTQESNAPVDQFLTDKVDDEAVRADCRTIIGLMEKTTGKPAKMWGPAIIGFDKIQYKYDSGREGEICLIGFSPRKANITLYVLNNFNGQDALLAQLGKYKAKGGCLHIKKLKEVDVAVLDSIIAKSAALKRQQHPA